MRLEKYRYLFRLIIVIIFVLGITIISFVSLLWNRSFEEIKRGNDIYYEKVLEYFSSSFTRELMTLKDYAVEITIDSRNESSPFYNGEEKYQENAYWYVEAVEEMGKKYSNYEVRECGVYYYNLKSIITKGAKQTLEEYVVNALEVSDEYKDVVLRFFADDNYQIMSMLHGTTNTKELANGKYLLGYCTTLGVNKDKVMIFYVIDPNDFRDILDMQLGVEGIQLYVLDKKSDQVYLAIGEAAKTDMLSFSETQNERGISGTGQKIVYRNEASPLPLTFVIHLTDDSLDNHVTNFYHDMKRMLLSVILLLLVICAIALWVEYKPLYKMMKEIDDYEGDEFTVIQTALESRTSIIREQNLWIMDLLVNHLIHGLPVTEQQLEKLGVNTIGKFFCVYTLHGYILLNSEAELIAYEIQNRFKARLFAIDLQGENGNIFIVFLDNSDTTFIERWLTDWLDGHLTCEYYFYQGKVVKDLNDIRSSFLDCYEKRNEHKKAERAIKADLDALRQKEEQQKKMKEEILDYLEIHYRDVDLSQTYVADAFRISTYTLSRMFKSQVGVGFTEYVNSKRLEYAKELLLTTTYSVHEIAFMVGFENDNYFSRLFKTNVGISPTTFRER